MDKLNTYDIKKIIGNKKYAKDNNFKVKQSEKLFLIKYIKKFLNSDNIGSYGRYRSIITDGETIVAMAPHKSYKFDDFKEKNKRDLTVICRGYNFCYISWFRVR